jgi:hypothetical protein
MRSLVVGKLGMIGCAKKEPGRKVAAAGDGTFAVDDAVVDEEMIMKVCEMMKMILIVIVQSLEGILLLSSPVVDIWPDVQE